MRVGFVAQQISEDNGGIQATSFLLTREMSKLCDFHCFCANESVVSSCSTENTYISKYSLDDNVKLHIDLIKSLFNENKKKRFDFTFSSLAPYALSCYLLKKTKKVPYGVLVHGNELMLRESKELKNKIKTTIKDKFNHKILENADIVFANSNYTKELCKSRFNCSNIVVIHPPIDFKEIEIDDSYKRNYRLLSIGRLVERKGFQYVVEAMPELIKVYPELEYDIGGDGSYKEVLKDLITSLDLSDHVHLLGRVSESKKDSLYRNCDAFIMPSFMIEDEAEVEGFGMVYVEANMYGKLAIATKSGGIPDAILEGETGLFVEEKDSTSIEEAIKKIYSNDFSYDKNKCIEWAREMGVNEIAKEYIMEIESIVQRGN